MRKADKSLERVTKEIEIEILVKRKFDEWALAKDMEIQKTIDMHIKSFSQDEARKNEMARETKRHMHIVEKSFAEMIKVIKILGKRK